MSIVRQIRLPRVDNDPEWIKRLMDLLSYQTYAGDPTNNAEPRWIRDWCHDTTNDNWYISHGTDSSDWQVVT